MVFPECFSLMFICLLHNSVIAITVSLRNYILESEPGQLFIDLKVHHLIHPVFFFQ